MVCKLSLTGIKWLESVQPVAMKRSTTSRQTRHLPYPTIAPIAGIFLLLGCFFQLIYSPREPKNTLVSVEATPRQQRNSCFRVPPSTSILVSLTADGRTSFAALDTKLQAATLQVLSKQYGVYLSATCVSRLSALPFLAAKIEQLPSILATPNFNTTASNQIGRYSGLTYKQLLSCVLTARELAPSCTQLPVTISLVVNAHTDASKVMHLLHMFQNQGINRFYLATHCQ